MARRSVSKAQMMQFRHGLSSGLLMGALVAVSACSRGEAQQAQQAGPPPAVPVATATALRKDMPLEMARHRHRRGLLHGGGARADHRRAHLGQLPAGRRRRGRAGALHARPPAARSGAAAGGGQSRTRHGAGRATPKRSAALRAAGRARHRRARAARHRARDRRRARGHARRRSRRGREREGAAAVRHHPRADLRAAPAR